METFALGRMLDVIVVFLQWSADLLNAQTTRTTPPSKPPKPSRTTQSYIEHLKEKKLKSLYFEYYPNYGFEPYWADGEWVLSTTTLLSTLRTKKSKVCGEECNYLLRRIKHVCARLSDDENKPINSCWGILQCSGKTGDDYNLGYKTFETYCEFLDAQCKIKYYERNRWVLVHIGKCKVLEDYFKPLWSEDQPVSRQAFYLSSLLNITTTKEYQKPN